MRIARFAVAFLAAILPLPALAQNAAVFTYQGKLTDGAAAANGTYDIRVTPYNAAAGGSALAPPVCADNVAVTDGLFSVQLPSTFPRGGGDVFLEFHIRVDAFGAVSCGDPLGFTTLTPRQPMTPAPAAAYASAVPAQSLERLGAIRYNAAENRFEGFTGTFWAPFVMGDPVTPANTQTFTTPGTHSFVVPAGVTTLGADVWGAGGGGGGMNAGGVTATSCPLPSAFRGGGGGGGGGAYTRVGIPVTPGETVTIVVGIGGGAGGLGIPGQAGEASRVRRGVIDLAVAPGGLGGNVGLVHPPSQGGAPSGMGGSGGAAPTAASGVTVTTSMLGANGGFGVAPNCVGSFPSVMFVPGTHGVGASARSGGAPLSSMGAGAGGNGGYNAANPAIGAAGAVRVFWN
ncbi:MAG TPA: hypothetical protein VD971_13640 [Phycisphaerales bacterium]|nr:hypothetical protein [Phycisphaerales bacterium]